MNYPHRWLYCRFSVLALHRTYKVPCSLMFHILVTVCPRSSISFLMSSRFALMSTCLRITLKLLSCFDLYVTFYICVFLLSNSFIMFTYAMKLFDWILICSFMIFISYSLRRLPLVVVITMKNYWFWQQRGWGFNCIFHSYVVLVIELLLESLEGIGCGHGFA